MARWSDNDYKKDELGYAIESFLEDHSISELLEMVADVVASKEQ